MTSRDPAFGARRGGPIGRLRMVPRAFVAAIGWCTLVVGVLAWLVLVSVPQVDLRLEETTKGRWIVSEVPIGERAWLVGIRPGMEVEGIEPADARPESWTTLAVGDGVVHVTVQRFSPPPDSLWLTLGIAALLGSTFAIGVAPTVAWSLLLAATLIGMAVASDYVTAPVSLLLVLTPPAIGALSVVDRERRLDPRVPWICVLLISLAVGCWLISYVLLFESWAVSRQVSAAIGIGLSISGTVAVVQQALWRAQTRLNRAWDHSPPAFLLLASTLDELVPGRARSRLSAMERERVAIAGDLHMEALPELAAVIRSVEGGMDHADAAARLRSVADELRELMTERRLTVLEELGLVPALEWLAERVEERTNVTVELDIQGDGAARVPPEVELHVYRIAQQALDNALVHGRPTRIRISIDIATDRLGLNVVDDGAGISPEAERRALRAGRLGIADMRQRAAAIGGVFSVLGHETGTMVAFRWPA